MEDNIEATFIKIIYMEKEFLITQMAKSILVISARIKKKDRDAFILMILLSILDILEMVKWMEKEFFFKKIKKLKEFGEMEN